MQSLNTYSYRHIVINNKSYTYILQKRYIYIYMVYLSITIIMHVLSFYMTFNEYFLLTVSIIEKKPMQLYIVN